MISSLQLYSSYHFQCIECWIFRFYLYLNLIIEFQNNLLGAVVVPLFYCILSNFSNNCINNENSSTCINLIQFRYNLCREPNISFVNNMFYDTENPVFMLYSLHCYKCMYIIFFPRLYYQE